MQKFIHFIIKIFFSVKKLNFFSRDLPKNLKLAIIKNFDYINIKKLQVLNKINIKNTTLQCHTHLTLRGRFKLC